jgi:hypothetical protein
MACSRCGYAITQFPSVSGLSGGTSVLHSVAIAATDVSDGARFFDGIQSLREPNEFREMMIEMADSGEITCSFD